MKKVRYCRQVDNFSCGPVAILNILKWLGKKVTYKTLPSLKIMCKTDIEIGTCHYPLERAMSSLQIKKKRKVHLKIKDLDAHLKTGGIALIEYFISAFDGHYTLCIGKVDGKYAMVNDSDTETVVFYDRPIVKKMLSKTRKDEKPWTWLIYDTKS